MKIKKNIPLKNLSTFKIGGKGLYLVEVEKKEEIKKAILFSQKKNLSFFILGNGSKILFPDGTLNKVLIKIKIKAKRKIGENKIIFGAGLLLKEAYHFAKDFSLSGFEYFSHIPGTIGGAIFMNASAFGKEIKDFLERVFVFDVRNFSFFWLEKKDLNFSYKKSIFQKEKNLIIIEAEFKLKKDKKEMIEKREKKFLKKRIETQPLNFPSCGCIFKNPQSYPAGYLIEKSSLKGKKIGEAKISEKHANFILNLGQAKSEDVKELISLIKKKVKEKFGISLKEEIIVL